MNIPEQGEMETLSKKILDNNDIIDDIETSLFGPSPNKLSEDTSTCTTIGKLIETVSSQNRRLTSISDELRKL